MNLELRAKFEALRKLAMRVGRKRKDTDGESIALFVDDVLEANGDWSALYQDLYQQVRHLESDLEPNAARINARLLEACKMIAPGLQCFGEKFSGTACGKETCPACAVHKAIAKAEGASDA